MRLWLSGPRLLGGLVRPGISLQPSGDAPFKEIVAGRAITVLRRLAKRGAAVKSGTSREAKWAVTPSLL
jgi:hypothetical protein